MDEKDARVSASCSTHLGKGLQLGEARELKDGWFFPFTSEVPIGGCNGVIVHKRTGKLFHLGSAFPVERDLELYDRGYQFESYDLVILDVRERKQTIHTLSRLQANVVEPMTEHGVTWRIPRRMTSAELSAKLDKLPCTFPAIALYFDVELLETARTAGWFTFETREHG